MTPWPTLLWHFSNLVLCHLGEYVPAMNTVLWFYWKAFKGHWTQRPILCTSVPAFLWGGSISRKDPSCVYCGDFSCLFCLIRLWVKGVQPKYRAQPEFVIRSRSDCWEREERYEDVKEKEQNSKTQVRLAWSSPFGCPEVPGEITNQILKESNQAQRKQPE